MLDDITLGNCIDLIPKLEDNSIQACITSPPYAKQRKLYDGISEEEFPDWMASWMNLLKPKMKANGSVLIVIRTLIRDGEISDYVLKTRLKLRETWIEAEELIWLKPDAPPLGSTRRPRRAFENILWYSPSRNPFVDLKACGNQKSKRIGGFVGSDRFGEGGDSPIAANQKRELSEGTSRCTDVFTSYVGEIARGVQHPAMYPSTLVDQLIQTFTQQGDTVLDPFMGSGTTALSAKRFGRHFVGFDAKEEYVQIAKSRISI